MGAIGPTAKRGKRIAPTGSVLLAILVVSWFWGCSTRKLMVAEMTGLMETGAAAMEVNGDLDMLQQALPANIQLMEALLASDPQNERLLVLLARLYGSYAFLFIDGRLETLELAGPQPSGDASAAGALKERAQNFYARGRDYALRALEIDHPYASERLRQVPASAAFVQSLQVKDLPAIFWYGFNLSGLIHHNRDSVGIIARAHLVEKSMRRALELQPDFYHGNAHLVLMVYYASRSPMMGGNPDLAEAHYRQLKALNGDGLLLTDLFYARYVLVQKQDRRHYEKLLKTIAENPDPDPRFRLFNRVAGDRARVYLAAADRLFEGN